MQTIQIDNAEIENFIDMKYGEDRTTLLSDFVAFVKIEIIAAEIKKGFNEVEQYRRGLKELGSVEDFISKLKSGN